MSGGNGKIKPTNGKPSNGKHLKKKGGRPKKENSLPKILIQSEAVKADGSPTKMADALGITPQSAEHHLNKPEIQELIEDARSKALKKAGITREKAYKRLAEGMDANATTTYEGEIIESKNVPDYKERRENTKIALMLIGDLDAQKNPPPPPNIFNFFIPKKDDITTIDIGEEPEYE